MEKCDKKRTCPFKKLKNFKERINHKKLLIYIIFQALIAGMYVALTVPYGDFGFRELQFRISEVLLFLILFDRKHIIGIILGTFIANLFSPMLVYDLTLGVLATILSCVFMGIFKKHYLIAFIFPAIFNGILVAVGLNVMYEVPYFVGMVQVGISEIILMYLLALPIFIIVRKTELRNLLYFNILSKQAK